VPELRRRTAKDLLRRRSELQRVWLLPQRLALDEVVARLWLVVVFVFQHARARCRCATRGTRCIGAGVNREQRV
jgi:hypothetical protein